MRANSGSLRATGLARAVLASALILTSAPSASAERSSSAEAVARNAEIEQQAIQVVYRDIADLLHSMQRALAQKQRQADAAAAANEALANPPRGERPVMPTYGDAGEPAEPCKGARLADWRRCLARVDLSRLGDAERRSLAPQVDALRAGVNAVANDARLSAAELRSWTVQLRRTSQTLDAMRVNRPIPH